MMNHKKPLLLLLVGPTLLCTVALVASINPAAIAQQQDNTGGNQNMTAVTTTTTTNNTGTSTAGTLDCEMAASGLGGIVIPNPTGVCDVAVPRQGLQVQDTATGATLNNLLVINPLFEFTQLSNQATTGAANQTMVYGFAEFALMEGELPSAMRMLSNSSWNVIAVHNHVIGESPSMIFAHAIANGDINTLVRDARMVLDSLMTQTQPQQGNQTTTTTGGMAGNATTTGGGITEGNMNNNSGIPSGVTGGTTDGGGGGAGNGTTTGGTEGGNGGGGGPLKSLGDILGGGKKKLKKVINKR